MSGDHRMSLDLITDVLDVLDRHGYSRGDNEHAGRAIRLIHDVARIYEGSQDHPFGLYIGEIPPRAEPEPPTPASPDTVTVPASEVRILFAALDIAADYKRDRAATCTDCLDKSCLTCQQRLQDARAYDQMAARLIHAAEEFAPPATTRSEPATQPQPAADREAGQ